MNYCPHCSKPLTKPVKVCPFCKKTVDIDMYAALFKPGETSTVSKKVIRKIWFQEHTNLIIPIISFIAGFILGAIILFGIAEAKFVSERSDYENRITELETVIKQKDQNANSTTAGFQTQINTKEAIINILLEQMDIMNRILNFTSRLANNSTITPNSAEEADYFKRNVLYLNRQFEIQQEKLKETGFSEPQSYNLIPIPQLLIE